MKRQQSSKDSHKNRLILDAQTVTDLEIFEPGTGGVCLFQFCNLTQTKGGAKVLRRRMEQPWSDAARIRATQESIAFITAQREAFANQPTAFTTNLVDQHYMHEIIPIITHKNVVEFSIAVFAMWADHEKHRYAITRGVQVICGMIQKLSAFVEQPELATPAGELGPLLKEMRELLNRPRLAQVPAAGVGRKIWKVLRLDQVFRLYEVKAIDRLLELIYEIDALVSMADVTLKHNFVMPLIQDGPLHTHAEGLLHPLVPKAVANPVVLDQECRALFLTGPNMAGKTTYLRAFATAFYLAHLGMGVPARSFHFAPAQRLFCSFSLSDDLNGGVSYFRAEALRTKAVAQAIADGYRVVALMDEPFKGTNVKDALDATLAILERFASKNDCLFMISSHLIELEEALSRNAQVDCRYFEAEESEGRLRFDYLLHKGVSSQRLGMRVLQEEGVFDLLDGKPLEPEVQSTQTKAKRTPSASEVITAR